MRLTHRLQIMKSPFVFVFLIFLISSNFLLAQNDTTVNSILETTPELPKADSLIDLRDEMPNNVFISGETKPLFPGGKLAMIEYISDSLMYPEQAISSKIEGRVVLKFIIDDRGKICCISYIGQPIGYGIEEEAIRLIKSMPRWTPATLDGIPVAVYYQLPITFKYFEE